MSHLLQTALADSSQRLGQTTTNLLVQLGDLGTGPTSGSPQAFEYAASYLRGFHTPLSLVTGNHDLEGVQYDSDPDNLAAWEAVFQQSHFWVRDAGPCVMIGLSTTRYRSNTMSHHEVRANLFVAACFFSGAVRCRCSMAGTGDS